MKRILLALLVLFAGTATADEIRAAGATSQCVSVFVSDSSSTTGVGLAGLTFDEVGLECWYFRSLTATGEVATQITLATSTLGTYASGAFKEIDADDMMGWYEFCPPDAAFATGANAVAFQCFGSTNMAPMNLRVILSGSLSAATTELSACPTATSSLEDSITFAKMLQRNKVSCTSSTCTLYKDDGTTPACAWSVSDNGTTASKAEGS